MPIDQVKSFKLFFFVIFISAKKIQEYQQMQAVWKRSAFGLLFRVFSTFTLHLQI